MLGLRGFGGGQAAAEIVRVESEEVARRRGEPNEQPPDNLVGLAISGGGIRSATFALGVLQGLAPRKLGKQDLQLTDADRQKAQEARDGWRLDGWSIDGAARVLALLRFSGSRDFAACFKDLRRTADAAELIALYRGLPLYPDPETLEFEVSEGLRSHMKSVFEAIAHDNPYPRDHFSEHRCRGK